MIRQITSDGVLFTSGNVNLAVMSEKGNSMDSSDYIAICAASISLVALSIGIYQSYLTRKHNKLSVRPHLSISRVSDYDKGLTYSLENNGLGPAIIKKFGIQIDEKNVPTENNVTFKALDTLKVSTENVGYYILDVDEAFSAGKQLLLLAFIDSEPQPEKYTDLNNILPRLKFRVEYECIYGEHFVLTSNGS